MTCQSAARQSWIDPLLLLLLLLLLPYASSSKPRHPIQQCTEAASPSHQDQHVALLNLHMVARRAGSGSGRRLRLRFPRCAAAGAHAVHAMVSGRARQCIWVGNRGLQGQQRGAGGEA